MTTRDQSPLAAVRTPAVRPPADSTEVADRVRAAVVAVPGVADMHSGSFGEVATYLPGRKVDGVRVRTDVTEVDVVLDWGVHVLETADRDRASVQAITGPTVTVVIQDVAAPPGAADATQ